ncbi:hypothetical protein ACXR0O_04525 [Verrucomicrobiota bacterium sgz303538]
MKKKSHRLLRRGPDFITEELVAVLARDEWFEFKPLFLLVRQNLRERNLAHGDAEMLRLRAYEKLQQLVKQGAVEKNGKEYRGIAPALESLKEHMAADHCRTLLQVVGNPSEGAVRDLGDLV